MLSPRERLEKARAENFFHEDGSPVVLKLLPGLNEEEVAKLEAELSAPLPSEINDFVRFARGFEFSPIGTVTFDRGFSFGMEELFPRAMPLCEDGLGNVWIVEVLRNGGWGPIFFVNHDPPVIVVHCKDIVFFLNELFNLRHPQHSNIIDRVQEASMHIWSEEQGIKASSLQDSSDEALCTFAKGLKSNDLVFDLRDQNVGSGFAWGRHGPSTENQRDGDTLIFARLTPAKGFFKRLLKR